MVNLIIRLFAGKLSSIVSSVILFAVLHGFAWLTAHVPAIAALCDPQAIADWLAAFLIAVLNMATNKYHLDNAAVERFEDSMKSNPPVIPVRRAEPVRPNETH